MSRMSDSECGLNKIDLELHILSLSTLADKVEDQDVILKVIE